MKNHFLTPNAPTTPEQLRSVLDGMGLGYEKVGDDFLVTEVDGEWCWTVCQERGMDVDLGIMGGAV